MKRKSVYKILGLAFALCLPFVFGCPLFELFGLSCPACGATRAWLCFFSGDLSGALRYHFFFWLIPLFLILYVLYDSGRMKRCAPFVKAGLYGSAAILFAYHIFRLSFGQ